MSIVNANPNPLTNLFATSPAVPTRAIEGQLLNLSPAQLVRATVVEARVGQAILEINRQNYLAQGERELQVGQKLNLQVLQTQPRLELRVLSSPLNDKLSQVLPLLTRSFDWSQLLGQLQNQIGRGALPPATINIYTQLQQILAPTAGLAPNIKGDIANIVMQLQQLSGSLGLNKGDLVLPPSSQMLTNVHPFSTPESSPAITQLLKNLQNQLFQLPKQGGQQLSKNWYAETRSILAPLQQGRAVPQLPVSQYQNLVAILNQFQSSPKVSPQLAGEVARILTQMVRGVAQDLWQPKIVTTEGQSSVSTVGAGEVGMATKPVDGQGLVRPESVAVVSEKVKTQLATDIKQLLDQLQPQKGEKISPELLGKLEGLLDRMQKLAPEHGKAPVLIPEFATLITQLSQLVEQPPLMPKGGQLGVLSQLFGFHLEAELLRGKKREALASLKLSLLNLQKELGAEVEEPLRRLELFQLCKAKLAEEQVQFLPLPFSELEEGYLLAERQKRAEDDTGEAPLQMSLSLRLSSLGNVRIDMLYEKSGLQLRLACEDREKMEYVQNCSVELEESLQAIELQGVSFSADAQLPAQQLQERLLPDVVNMLDARI